MQFLHTSFSNIRYHIWVDSWWVSINLQILTGFLHRFSVRIQERSQVNFKMKKSINFEQFIEIDLGLFLSRYRKSMLKCPSRIDPLIWKCWKYEERNWIRISRTQVILHTLVFTVVWNVGESYGNSFRKWKENKWLKGF